MIDKLITFGGALYDYTTERMLRDAPRLGGVHSIEVYDDLWLTRQPFYEQNTWLWQHPHKRGFGWYAWKPYIIMHALAHYSVAGDVVMYLDADSYPIASFAHLFQQCKDEGGIMLFRAGHWKHLNWCKRDCYVVMNADQGQYIDPNQSAGVARFMLFQNGPWRVKQFLMEWLTYCVNPLATTFDPSVIKPEYPTLNEHRTEQAIMTNLAIRYGIPLHPEADTEMGLFEQNNQRPLPTRQTTAEVGMGSRFRNVD